MSDEIYSRIKDIDLRVALKGRGVVLDARDFTYAPWRDERTPSVKIYADHFHDYGDPERRGDFIDWLEQAETMDKSRALEEVERILGGSVVGTRPSLRRTKNSAPPLAVTGKIDQLKPLWIPSLVVQSNEALMKGESEAAKAAWTYLTARRLDVYASAHKLGVVDESVNVPEAGRMMARLRGRLVIPTLDQDVPIWFKARDLSGRSAEVLKAAGVSRYDGPPGRVPAPFNIGALEQAGTLGFVVLTEGETDALSLLVAYGSGYPVLGLPGGLLPPDLSSQLQRTGVREVVLFTDRDSAGTRHAERSKNELTAAGLRVVDVTPSGYGDLNEMLVALGPEVMVELLDAAVSDARAGETSDLLYIRQDWLAELDSRARRPHPSYSTGLEALDKLLDGGYLEGLHLLGGITGGGKTSLALSVALHNALAGRPVLYGSYEQSRLELWARVASHLTRLPYSAIKRGTYNELGTATLVSSELQNSGGWKDLERAARFLRVVEGGDALSRTTGTHAVDDLARAAQSMAERSGAPPLIILDYLQRMPVPQELRIKDTRERVSFVAGQLQVTLARGLGCPVLALSSVGRAAYRLADTDVEGRLAAFKEAGELEYTAYTALLLYDLPESAQATLGLAPGVLSQFRPMTLDLCKNREGETGRVAAKWEPQWGVWRDTQTFPREAKAGRF